MRLAVELLWRLVLAGVFALGVAVSGHSAQGHCGEIEPPPGRLAVVILDEAPQVAGHEILLGEIACIAGEEAERLAKVSVGTAPLVGSVRELDAAAVRLRLRQAGIPDREIELVAPAPRLWVQRAGSLIEGTALDDAVARALAERYPDDAQVRVSTGAADDLTAPVGEVELRVARVPALATGTASVPIEVRVDGELWRTVHVRAEVEVRHAVWVALQRIDRGEPIGPHNARLEHTVIPPGRRPALLADDTPLRAARVIQSGSLIEERFVEPLPDALAGDRISLWATASGVQVQTTGILLADARVGQTVPVRNEASGQTVYGRLVDSSQVAVAIWTP